MEVGRQPLLEREFPYYARECCPECGTAVDLRTALCGDERDPKRRVGCTGCGLWLVRNERTRTRWLPLLAWLAVLFVLNAVVQILAREHLSWGWASLVNTALILATVCAAVRLLNERYVRRIGPPWVPADGERADLSR